MAKKVVATLKKGTGGREYTKVIKMIKNPETGNYSFKEEIVHNDKVKAWFDEKSEAKPDDKKGA